MKFEICINEEFINLFQSLHERGGEKSVNSEDIHDHLPNLWESFIWINEIPFASVGHLLIKVAVYVKVVIYRHSLNFLLVSSSHAIHNHLLPKVTPRLTPEISNSFLALYLIHFFEGLKLAFLVCDCLDKHVLLLSADLSLHVLVAFCNPFAKAFALSLLFFILTCSTTC